MTENLSLREVLSELADEVQTIELGARAQQTRQTLRRRRAGVAALATAVVLGAGGFAWSQAPAGGDPGQSPGGILTTTTSTAPTATPACCVLSRTTAAPTTPTRSDSGFFAYTPLPTTIAPTTTNSSSPATRPPSATPPEAVPAGHGCAAAWTDESSGNGSPFASSAQREAAASMGTALCGHLRAAKVTRLVEWISMRGLNHVGEGVTYDVQASGPATAVYLEIFRGTARSIGATPTITNQGGALRADWPDGTVVLMTKGKDAPTTRAIVADPAFDLFGG